MRSAAPALLLALLLAAPAVAEEPEPAAPAAEAPPAPERFAVHYQATVATQTHGPFTAPYTGPHSLLPVRESATSIVADLFLSARLWPGAELHVQPEVSGGRGLSSTLGVAAFPSGEVYRVGDPAVTVDLGRAFLRQVIGLGGGMAAVEAGPNALAGSRDRDALTLLAGRLSTADLVDVNPWSSDPHVRFMSWGLWASAAYDYPADTRGYTWGLGADLSVGRWSLRAGGFLEPRVANGMELEWDPTRSAGWVAEGELRWSLGERPGAVRALAFRNVAPMGSYAEALALPGLPDVVATRAPGRTKHGLAASANQELAAGAGVFARLSWNDGRNESWAFTEIDRSAAAGLVWSGAAWHRPADEVGAAVVVSGLSADHRRYLAAGGLGFLLGDGALRYAPEVVGELYYRLALTREIAAGVNWQPIAHPGYNADRGPVQVFTGRVHVAL